MLHVGGLLKGCALGVDVLPLLQKKNAFLSKKAKIDLVRNFLGEGVNNFWGRRHKNRKELASEGL